MPWFFLLTSCPLYRLEPDPELWSLPKSHESEILIERQTILTRRRIQIKLPQDLGDEYPQQSQSYRTARTPSRPLAERLGRLEIVIFESWIESRVIRRQPSFRTELERVAKEARASCCSKVADLAGHLVGLYVSKFIHVVGSGVGYCDLRLWECVPRPREPQGLLAAARQPFLGGGEGSHTRRPAYISSQLSSRYLWRRR